MKKLTPFFALVIVMCILLSACGTPAAPTAAPANDVPTAAAAQPTDVPAVAAPTDTAAAAGPTETPAPTANPNAIITFWSWVPHIEDQVAEWNTLHPDMQVNYVNSGGGNGNYTKLKVALQANTGIPDVVQIEYQHLPN